jgi:hypothetical protein
MARMGLYMDNERRVRNRLRPANKSGPPEWPKEVDMDAVSQRWDLSMRRAVALFLGLAAIVLLAGGAGGYLIRGATTLVVTHTVIRTVSNTPTQPAPGVRTSGGYIPGL